MKNWLRLTLITLTVGGGFTGTAATLQQLLRPSSNHAAYLVLVTLFLVLYIFVTVSGLLFVNDRQRTGPLLIAFAIQIPWVSSPVFAYRFTAGFHGSIALLGGAFNGGFTLGSGWQCELFRDLPWGFGVNLFALLIVVLLARSRLPPSG